MRLLFALSIFLLSGLFLVGTAFAQLAPNRAGDVTLTATGWNCDNPSLGKADCNNDLQSQAAEFEEFTVCPIGQTPMCTTTDIKSYRNPIPCLYLCSAKLYCFCVSDALIEQYSKYD